MPFAGHHAVTPHRLEANEVGNNVRDCFYGNSGLSANHGLWDLVVLSASCKTGLDGSRISGRPSSLGRASATTSSVEWTPNFDMRLCRWVRTVFADNCNCFAISF